MARTVYTNAVDKAVIMYRNTRKQRAVCQQSSSCWVRSSCRTNKQAGGQTDRQQSVMRLPMGWFRKSSNKTWALPHFTGAIQQQHEEETKHCCWHWLPITPTASSERVTSPAERYLKCSLICTPITSRPLKFTSSGPLINYMYTVYCKRRFRFLDPHLSQNPPSSLADRDVIGSNWKSIQ